MGGLSGCLNQPVFPNALSVSNKCVHLCFGLFVLLKRNLTRELHVLTYDMKLIFATWIYFLLDFSVNLHVVPKLVINLSSVRKKKLLIFVCFSESPFRFFFSCICFKYWVSVQTVTEWTVFYTYRGFLQHHTSILTVLLREIMFLTLKWLLISVTIRSIYFSGHCLRHFWKVLVFCLCCFWAFYRFELKVSVCLMCTKDSFSLLWLWGARWELKSDTAFKRYLCLFIATCLDQCLGWFNGAWEKSKSVIWLKKKDAVLFVWALELMHYEIDYQKKKLKLKSNGCGLKKGLIA